MAAGLSPALMSQEPRVFFRSVAHVALSRLDDWQYVSLLRILIGESARFPELADVYINKLVKPAIQNLCTYIRANEKMKFKDPEAVARIFHGALVHFIISQEILNCKHTLPMPRERVEETIVDLVLFAAEGMREAR